MGLFNPIWMTKNPAKQEGKENAEGQEHKKGEDSLFPVLGGVKAEGIEKPRRNRKCDQNRTPRNLCISDNQCR